MNYKDNIIADISGRECKRLSMKVIRFLQKMTEGMQSGDDSPLKNIWDEVCVQVQGEESVLWDAYLDTIQALIAGEVAGLDTATKQAIWLQTNEGSEWDIENEDPTSIPFSEEDISIFIMDSYVLSVAADWTNQRIQKYLE